MLSAFRIAPNIDLINPRGTRCSTVQTHGRSFSRARRRLQIRLCPSFSRTLGGHSSLTKGLHSRPESNGRMGSAGNNRHRAGIKRTAVFQGVPSHSTALTLRTPHEQAATTHGRRFRPRYESQAAAQRPRHRAQNQRRADRQTGCMGNPQEKSEQLIEPERA